MIKIIKLIGAFWLTLAVLYGCGGTTSSGASSPVTPAQIPTSVEYAAGDVIITGVMPSGSLGSISKSANKATSSTMTAYAMSKVGVLYSATIDTDNRFYIKVPAGAPYTHMFADGLTSAPYQDTDSGLHSIPLIFVSGASASGTEEFTDGVATDTLVNVVDIGTASISADISADEDVYGLSKSTVTGSSPLSSQLNYGSTTVAGTATNDSSLWRLANLDTDGNGIVDYTERKFTKFTITYIASSSEDTDNLISAYSDPTKFSNASYFYSLRPRINCDATFGSCTDVAASVLSAELKAPAEIVYNGTTYASGSAIPSCGDVAGHVMYNFLCSGDTISTITPKKPPEGTYTATVSTTTYTLANIKTLDINNSAEIGNNIPFVLIKMRTTGNTITGFDWKWQWKVSGTWTDMTENEIKSTVDTVESGGGTDNDYYIVVDMKDQGGTSYTKYAALASETITRGSASFDSTLDKDQVLYISAQYTDIAGFVHWTQWNNN
jgi:hypothetical protein